MASLPSFIFPPQSPSTLDREETHIDTSTRRERPHISLRTNPPSGEREGLSYTLSVPETAWDKRSRGLKACYTPPDSPIRPRASTIGSSTNNSGMDSYSPPPTPTRPTYGRLPSSSAQFVQEKEKVSSDEVITFPYQVTDYAITTTNHKGSKKLLGSGVWSDVYHATPALPNPSSRPGPVTEASPPVTPHSRSSSTSTTASLPAIPRAYAIKTPSSAAAHKVLREEARILSYLSRMPGNEKHMVPFYGQDPRTDALVLKCMDNTLDSWLTTTLNPLPEPVRATTLAQTFPALAKQLLDALSWLSRHGVVHADIKPANMLLVSDPGSSVPDLVLTDFSSAILTLPTSSSSSSSSSSSTASSPNKTQGGGTWDFLSPHFFHTATRNAAPTPSADLWATAMTLLVLVLGASPYDFLAAHLFRRRECVKQGDPMAYIAYGDFAARNRKRIGMLSAALGVDVEAWFGLVLGKAGVGGVHVDVEGWKVRLLEGLEGRLVERA